MADTQKLRELAQAATQGLWVMRAGRTDPREMLIYGHVDGLYRVAEVFDANGMPENRNNAAFIAAANPATVLKLLEVVDKARDVVSAYDAFQQTPAAQFTGDEMPRCERADAALRAAIRGLDGQEQESRHE